MGGTKVAAGILCGLLAQPPGNVSPSRWFLFTQLLALTAGALYLAAGSQRDRRALWLGLSFLIGGSTFADPLIARAASVVPAVATLNQTLHDLQVAAFLPYTIWLFFADFPYVTTFSAVARIPTVARRVCLWVGAALFSANLIASLEPAATGAWGVLLRLLDRDTSGGLFWPLVFGLTTAGFGFGVWNARNARLEERRRVRLLMAALVLGCAPIVLVVLITESWPLAERLVGEPSVFAVVQWLVYPPLLLVPLATAYAVHVHQALDVRFYVRRALQYALARYSVLFVATVPFAAFLLMLYRERDQRVADLLASGAGAALLTAGVTGVVLARTRKWMLAAVDKRFFREQFDARRILRELVGGLRQLENLAELESLVTLEIERALHTQCAALLVLNARGEHFVSRLGRARSLPVSARLARLLKEGSEPLHLNLESSDLLSLPEAERTWLIDGGFSLLIPLWDAASELLGFFALGEKRSELPFTDEDHAILLAVGSATAVVLERRLLVSERSSDGSGVPTAGECPQCGLVSAAEEVACSRCGSHLGEATVPLLLAGKFLMEERIGAGGMGVVYRARDVILDRPVAIKTLRPMGMLLAWRLRREARAMALVTHPNLASIYGLEAWNGTPMLVVEYLSGGALDRRIAQGPLSLTETLELGLLLLGVVDRIHRAGILHRDIKPSNIGFTGDGVPKLLDFGLARMMDTALGDAPGVWASKTSAGQNVTEAEWATGTGIVLGTPEYMSPEAAAGEKPDPSFDLWSVAVVIFEMLAGHPPFRGTMPAQTLRLIQAGGAPDIRESAPACPSSVAKFLRDALAVERSCRPATAKAMSERLSTLRVA